MPRRDTVLGFLDDLAEVRSVDGFHDVVLPGLARLVPADLWGFNDIDVHRRRVLALTWPDPQVPEPHGSALDEVVWEHPILRHFQQTGNGAACRISDFWTRERLHASALYQRAYGPVGVEHQVGFSLADGPSASTTFFAANRREQDFRDEELVLLDALRRHLHVAWQRVHSGRAVDALVAAGEAPVLVLDERRRVRAGSDEALALLAAAGLPVGPGEPVPEPLLSWSRRAGPGVEPLGIGSDGDAVAVAVVAGGPDVDLVLALRAVTARGLATLSARERAVLEAVAAGATTAEAARQLGVSPRTVQKHLERIYGKLGVHNRTAAAPCWPGRGAYVIRRSDGGAAAGHHAAAPSRSRPEGDP